MPGAEMAEEPKYPEDAKVGDDEAPPADPRRKKQIVRTGVAVGIGSAAIVAALLYANRGKRNDKGSS